MERILKYIITAILLITVNLSYAQETVNPILTGKATVINFGIGDTIGLITGFSDQTGFGFTLDSLKKNAVIIDQSGTIWKVNTITSQNALQAAIRIQKVYGTGLFPSGEIAISNVTTNYKFPSPATTNSTGITPKQQAEMLNYIIQKIDQQITEGESINTIASNEAKNDNDASQNGVPIGGFYITSPHNTMGLRPGIIIQRKY